MPRCSVDKSIIRKVISGVAFPLGVYPVEEMTPRTGYTLTFEPADGDDDDGEWEEWPDRYVFDIMLSATRVEALCRSLFVMLPGRFYPILDVLGHDEYREVDPYVAYELISQERFHDAIRRYRGFFYEDGLVGFGAMSEEPFVYIFVDEHKIVTVRVQSDLRDRVERLLAAFDLVEVDEIAGADAATHEHRGVLEAPDDRMDLLTADEIVEELRNDWGLVLNIDPDTNVDDEGNELGITAWRCLARHEVSPNVAPSDDPAAAPAAPAATSADQGESRDKGKDKGRGKGEGQAGGQAADEAGGDAWDDAADEPGSKGPGEGQEASSPSTPVPPPLQIKSRYAEVLLTAESIASAERLLWEGMEELTGLAGGEGVAGTEGIALPPDDGDAVNIAIALDRVTPESFAELLKNLPKDDAAHGSTPDLSQPKVWHARWLE